MSKSISPKRYPISLVVVCLISISGFAQKGKPPACPVPPPVPGDTECFGGSGCLDPAFATNGSLLFRPALGNVTDIGIEKAIVQPDGKIVGAGQVFDAARATHRDVFLIRVHPSGQLDTSFGDDDPGNPGLRLGYAIDQIGNASTVADLAYSVAYSAYDGKIIVSGSSGGASIVVRYTADGRRDTSFGTNGVVRPGIGLQAMDVAVQSDGKIVANLWDRFTAVRLNTDGSFDTSFGSGGIAAYNASATAYGSGSARSIAIQTIQTADGPEERILLGGTGYDAATRKAQSSAVQQFAMMRLTQGGMIDHSFGTNGRTKTSLFGRIDRIMAITVDAENKIIAAGQASVNSCDENWDAGVARYSENGVFEWKANIDFFGYSNWAKDVKTQVIGGEVKVLGVGMSALFTGSTQDLAVFRLNADGTPDASFGPGTFGPGKVTANFGGTDHGLGIAVDAVNNILIVGSSSGGNPANAATITRYFP